MATSDSTVRSDDATSAPAGGADSPPGRTIRRGLPRTASGIPTPTNADSTAPDAGGSRRADPAEAGSHAEVSRAEPSVPPARAARRGLARPDAAPAGPTRAASADAQPDTPVDEVTTIRTSDTASRPADGPPGDERRRYGPYTTRQWVGASILAALGLLFLVAAVALSARWLEALEPVQRFMSRYSGEYALPDTAPIGIPAWIGWQHFFNTFLIVLIIRSGLQVRREKRPRAFWSPRWNPERKLSLALWLHQSLDILWLLNGVIFVVLLLATGQWVRIVPTSWEVFPNAVSAALQYASLDWPTENGWVNYNSLQQLAYFATVFVAAPLAAITGVRMSGVWPDGAKTLNRLYSVRLARAVHFPVMVYFVVFIVTHVSLVVLPRQVV